MNNNTVKQNMLMPVRTCAGEDGKTRARKKGCSCLATSMLVKHTRGMPFEATSSVHTQAKPQKTGSTLFQWLREFCLIAGLEGINTSVGLASMEQHAQ